MEKYNRFPSYPEASQYMIIKLLIMGMEKAGSTDPAAVVKALEGMEYDGLTGTELIQAFDHQVKKNYYLLQAKAAAAVAALPSRLHALQRGERPYDVRVSADLQRLLGDLRSEGHSSA